MFTNMNLNQKTIHTYRLVLKEPTRHHMIKSVFKIRKSLKKQKNRSKTNSIHWDLKEKKDIFPRSRHPLLQD